MLFLLGQQGLYRKFFFNFLLDTSVFISKPRLLKLSQARFINRRYRFIVVLDPMSFIGLSELLGNIGTEGVLDQE